MHRWLLVALVACRSDAPPPSPDAALDAGVSATCTGACAVTALSAAFQTTHVLDEAVFGFTTSDSTLHVEAYRGGAGGCPSNTSPTPDYTLVLGKVAMPTGTAGTSSPGNVLDFVGDLLGGSLGAQATMVSIFAVAAGTDFVALDIALEFTDGMVTGHLYATHCDSLDSP